MDVLWAVLDKKGKHTFIITILLGVVLIIDQVGDDEYVDEED